MPMITVPLDLVDEYGFICEAVVKIEFDHTAYEAPSRDCPGSAETVTVTHAEVWFGNTKLGDHPSLDWAGEVWAHIKSTREAAELERAERRAA